MLESDLPVSWRVSARVDRMDKELLALMCQAGCHEMFFGIESGSAEIQKSIHKNLDVGEIVPMLAYAQHVGIKPTASFIVGFPDETLENIRETKNMAVELVKRGVKDVQFHMLVPLPGSPLGKTFENQFVFDEALAKMPGPMWQASDWDLIRRYPAIFASFYSFPLQHVTPLQLREAYLGMAFTVKGLALFFRLWRAPLNLIRRIMLHKRTPSEFQT